MLEIEKTTTVARVNNVDIVVIEGETKRVAVRTICQALGIDEWAQIQKLNRDPILGSVACMAQATGADGKHYEMVTIPFKYVFGWLFRIDSRSINEEARDAVLKYQMECYEVLYRHFTSYAEFVEQKEAKIEAQLKLEDQAKSDFKNAKEILWEVQQELKALRKLTFEHFDPNNHQFKIEFQ